MTNRQRGLGAVIAAVGLAGGIAAFALTLGRTHDELRAVGHPKEPVFVLLIGLSFVMSGLTAWIHRPHARFGPLMMAVGFAWFLAALEAANAALPFSIGLAFAPLWIGIFFQALLAFPTGRLESLAARWLVAVYYVDVVLVQFAWLVFANVRGSTGCSGCPDNAFLIADKPHLAQAILIVEQPAISVAVLTGGVLLLVHRWQRATPASRRAVAPVFASGGLCLLILLLTVLVEPFSYTGGQIVGWVSAFAFTAVPLAFLAGQARSRLDRIAVGDLVVELGETPPPKRLRDVLARAIHDPSLEIAYSLNDGRWVDVQGRDTELPTTDSGRSTTLVRRSGRTVAALVHDSSVDDEPGLVNAVAAAAGLTLENERLHADLRARLEDLAESRARIVETADAERRRLERNLHDGAQQRLVSLALTLRLAKLQRDENSPQADDLLTEASDELQAALDELRELARGIHPAVLTDRGLRPAVEALAARAPIPVVIECVPEQRPPAPIEIAAYYLVSEALTNVAKYAQASAAHVSIYTRGSGVVIEVADNGIGGADMSAGSGLQGLHDRIGALGGHVAIDSTPGAGTTITAEIPLKA